MKIELNENALYTSFWLIVGISLTSAIITCTYWHHNKEIKFAQAGLVEVQKEGSTLTFWTKPSN